MYVKKQLRTNVICFPFTRQIGVEDLWVSVQSHKHQAIIIGCVYRHPKAPVVSFDYVQDVFRQLCFSKIGFFVLGDFNNNLFVIVNKLSAIIGNIKLTQLTDEPTRVTPTSATLLDVIITNKPGLIVSIVGRR